MGSRVGLGRPRRWRAECPSFTFETICFKQRYSVYSGADLFDGFYQFPTLTTMYLLLSRLQGKCPGPEFVGAARNIYPSAFSATRFPGPWKVLFSFFEGDHTDDEGKKKVVGSGVGLGRSRRWKAESPSCVFSSMP